MEIDVRWLIAGGVSARMEPARAGDHNRLATALIDTTALWLHLLHQQNKPCLQSEKDNV